MNKTYSGLSLAAAFIIGSLLLYFSLYLLLVLFPIIILATGLMFWLKMRNFQKCRNRTRVESNRSAGPKIIDAEYEILSEKNTEKK